MNSVYGVDIDNLADVVLGVADGYPCENDVMIAIWYFEESLNSCVIEAVRKRLNVM